MNVVLGNAFLFGGAFVGFSMCKGIRLLKRFIIFFCLFTFLFVGVASAFSASVVKTSVQRVLTKACTVQGVPANDNRCLRLISGANTVLANTISTGYFLVTKNWLGLLLTLIFMYFNGDKEIALSNDKKITIDSNLVVIKEETKETTLDLPVVEDFSFDECIGDVGCSYLSSYAIDENYDNTDRVIINGASFQACARHVFSGVARLECSSYYHSRLKNLAQYLVKNPGHSPFFEVGATPQGLYFKNGILNRYYESGDSKKHLAGYSSEVYYKNSLGNIENSRVYFVMKSGDYAQVDYSSDSNDLNSEALSNFAENVVSYPNISLEDYLNQANLSEFELGNALSPSIIAEAVDALYQSVASQENYDGLPYQVGIITPETVQNIGILPSLGDGIQSITYTTTSTGNKYDVDLNPDISTSPTPDPVPDPTPNPDYDINVDVDFGPDPGIGVPTLEDIPTASNILDPIFNLFPVLRNFEVPSSNGGVCPHLQFEMFEHSYDISAHCDLLEEQKTVIQSVFSLFWLMLSIIIVLGA